MFVRGQGSMVSLQSASRRLQVPVDTLWKWVTEGRITAEMRPGRGAGLEYFLDPFEMKRARALRDQHREAAGPDTNPAAGDLTLTNVISLDFSEPPVPTGAKDAERKQAGVLSCADAVTALDNLRSEALSAVERQAGREAAIGELAAAVQALMDSVLEAMDRAQDANQGRLVAELEALRLRLSRQIQDREQNDLRLRDRLAETRAELGSALEAVSPKPTFRFARRRS